MADRPILVTIIGGLSLIFGILSIVLGIIGFVGIAIPGLGEAIGIAGLIGVIVVAIVGYGMLKGWAIFWYLGVLVYLLVALGGIYALVMTAATGMIVTIAIAVVFLLYFFSKKVKAFFLEK